MNRWSLLTLSTDSLRKLVLLVIIIGHQKVWGLMMMQLESSQDEQLNEQWPYKRHSNFEPFTIGNYNRQIAPMTHTICLDHFSWCYTSTSPVWKPLGQIHHFALSCISTDKIHTASCTYIHVVLSLCHLYSLTVTWRVTSKWEVPKDTFLMQSLVLSSHNFTPKRSELRYHCCLSQLYFIGH
jgi:hypothetical protein